MPDSSAKDSTELSEFIRDTLASVEGGTKDTSYTLKGDIEFELAVVTTKKVGGGFKILVAELRGKYEKEKLSKMKFSIGRRAGAVVISRGYNVRRRE